MAAVGIRDLRNSLSRYLDRVRRGETITITDHGTPIAHIIPSGLPEHLRELMVQGRITWSGTRFQAPTNPIRLEPGRTLADYITEERR